MPGRMRRSEDHCVKADEAPPTKIAANGSGYPSMPGLPSESSEVEAENMQGHEGLGEHSLILIHKKVDDAGRIKYQQRRCTVCGSRNAAHYCSGPMCGEKFVVCKSSKRRCLMKHCEVQTDAATSTSSSSSNSSTGAPVAPAVPATCPETKERASFSGHRFLLGTSGEDAGATEGESISPDHLLCLINKKIDDKGRNKYQQRTCTVCGSRNAAHYCSGPMCGEKHVVCKSGKRNCLVRHCEMRAATANSIENCSTSVPRAPLRHLSTSNSTDEVEGQATSTEHNLCLIHKKIDDKGRIKYRQLRCTVCGNRNAAHYCSGPMCGEKFVVCKNGNRNCLVKHCEMQSAAANSSSSSSNSSSVDTAPTLANVPIRSKVKGWTGPYEIVQQLPSDATMADTDNVDHGTEGHSLALLHKKIDAKGRTKYQQRQCTICGSRNAAHYCSGPMCGAKHIVCRSGERKCFVKHCNMHVAPANSSDGSGQEASSCASI